MFDPRISLITLGVSDVEASSQFYERLGFRRSSASVPGTSFFQLGQVVLSIFGRSDLAHDAGVVDARTPGFSGVTLSCNVGSDAEVDALLAHAVASGARLTAAGAKAHWGGYIGYFADPDGHVWEVAHNPFWPLSKDGAISLPV
jgi:predicted lactoylglutathione lyase